MIDTTELFKRNEGVHWSRDFVPPLLRWNGLVFSLRDGTLRRLRLNYNFLFKKKN